MVEGEERGGPGGGRRGAGGGGGRRWTCNRSFSQYDQAKQVHLIKLGKCKSRMQSSVVVVFFSINLFGCEQKEN